jgi:hypothetical protein
MQCNSMQFNAIQSNNNNEFVGNSKREKRRVCRCHPRWCHRHHDVWRVSQSGVSHSVTDDDVTYASVRPSISALNSSE